MSLKMWDGARKVLIAGRGMMDSQLDTNSNNGVKNRVVAETIDQINTDLSGKVAGFDESTYAAVTGLAYDATNKKLGLKVGADTVIPFSSGDYKLVTGLTSNTSHEALSITGSSASPNYGALYELFNLAASKHLTIGGASYDIQKVYWNGNGPITISLKTKKAMKDVIITCATQSGRAIYMSLAPLELRGCSLSSGGSATFIANGYKIASIPANTTITLSFSKIDVKPPNSSTTITAVGLDNITFLYKDA